ncbi:MAG: hypothetical protein ACM3SW_18740 [Actinomycetota bacterium]
MSSRPSFWRRFWLALAAVLAGNAIYFGVQRFLPVAGRHTAFRIDLGLVLDFWICLVIFVLLLTCFASRH